MYRSPDWYTVWCIHSEEIFCKNYQVNNLMVNTKFKEIYRTLMYKQTEIDIFYNHVNIFWYVRLPIYYVINKWIKVDLIEFHWVCEWNRKFPSRLPLSVHDMSNTKHTISLCWNKRSNSTSEFLFLSNQVCQHAFCYCNEKNSCAYISMTILYHKQNISVTKYNNKWYKIWVIKDPDKMKEFTLFESFTTNVQYM